ncbi:MAG: VOC family protein [Patescibacteria group bacterium]|jgi:catechol 2,3-dioxygenase-like lactoylglutathione lyase family enzyme
MKSSLDHISINVSNSQKSIPFYRSLFKYLEYDFLKDKKDSLAVRKKGDCDFWIYPTDSKHIPHGFCVNNTGLGHIAFRVSSKEDVDRFHEEYLKPNNVRVFNGGPKAFPQYTPDYYAVFFEDPDRIKLEVNSFKR